MAVTDIANLPLGKLLQIAFVDGIRNQVSVEHREFDMIKTKSVSSEAPREIRFGLEESLLPNNVGYLDSAASAFPTEFNMEFNEYIAKMKTISGVIGESIELWQRAESTPLVYGKPLLRKADAIARSLRRQISADVHGDGTGVIGTVASVDATNINASAPAGSFPYSIDVTLSSANSARGFIGWFEFGGLYKAYAVTGGSAIAPTGGSGFSVFKCVKKDRANNKVTLQLVQADGSTVATGYTDAVVAATNVFYRRSQESVVNLSTIGANDYGALTGVFAGLETLGANDGRKVHGMLMQGVLAGSRYDAGAATIDTIHLLAALDQGKVTVGDVYKYKTMLVAPETAAVFIDAKESDRRFNAVADNGRGSSGFTYTHYNDTLSVETTEFVRKDRIWMAPEDAAGNRVLELHMRDLMPIKVGGVEEFLKPASGGGFSRNLFKAWEGYLTLISRHPAAIISINNFTLGS